MDIFKRFLNWWRDRFGKKPKMEDERNEADTAVLDAFDQWDKQKQQENQE